MGHVCFFVHRYRTSHCGSAGAGHVFAIQDYCERKHGYSVVRELVGHGVGRSLHEDPEVPDYGKRGKGMLLRDGLVVAIEPMINLGVKEIYQTTDGPSTPAIGSPAHTTNIRWSCAKEKRICQITPSFWTQ